MARKTTARRSTSSGKKAKAESLPEPSKVNLTRKNVFIIVGLMALSLAAIIIVARQVGLSIWVKLILAAAILFVGRLVLKRMEGFTDYHGMMLLRGEKGLNAMKRYASKYGPLAKELADLGLTLSYGIFFAAYLFRKDMKKLILHISLSVLFFFGLSYVSLQNQGAFTIDTASFAVSGALLGFLGVGLSSLGLGVWRVFTLPSAPAAVTAIIPGVTVPIVEGIFAIVIALIFHEMAHGVLAVLEGIKVKYSGLVFLGGMPAGAFVEPDEEAMAKLSIHKRRRIMVAGTTANVIVFLVFLILSVPVVAGLAVTPTALSIIEVKAGSASVGFLRAGDYIYSANGAPVKSVEELQKQLDGKHEGDLMVLATQRGAVNVVLGKDAKLGIALSVVGTPGSEFQFEGLSFLMRLFGLTALINFALAIVNTLPFFVPPILGTDGFQLVAGEIRELLPKRHKDKANNITLGIGAVIVLLIILNFIPHFR